MWRRISRRSAAGERTAASERSRLLRWTGWMGVANTLLLVSVSLRNLAVTDPPHGALARLYGVSMFLGHGAFLAFLPALLVLPLIFIWPRRGPVITLGTALGAALVFTTLVDTIVFQQYRFHLNAEVFNLLFGGAAGEILVFSTTMYLQAGLVLAAILAGQVLLARLLWRRLPRAGARGRLGAAVALLLVAAFVVQAAIHAWADVAGYTPVTRQSRVLMAYAPVTAETLFRKLGFNVERADAALLARDHGTNLAYPRRPLSCTAPAERPNILFIVIDGWRFDALNAAVTPNIFRFADRTLRFTDHLSGGSASRTGIFAMFYGIPGTYWHAMLAEQRGPVLVSRLRETGYEVSIFSAAALTNPEFDRTIFAEVPDLRMRSDGDSPSERDLDLTRDFLEFLERRSPDRPFFSLLFYDAAHGYDIPDDYPRPFRPSWDDVNYLLLNNDFDPVPFHNRYLNCVHFNDMLVGQVLDALERRELLDETLVLITGDHGQEFNENRLNYWGHDSNFSRYQVAVPLVLYWPGRQPAVLHHRTSHYDVVPTLMEELLGCTNDYGDYSVGHHLLEPGGREVLLLANYTDYALVQPDRIVAVHPWGVETLDPQYRPIPGATLERSLMLTALEQRGRFYK